MMRRVLRIWPLYFLMVITGFVLLPMLAPVFKIPVTLPPVWYYLIFASNFYTVPHVFFLMFLWSIAVEEQLYLLFAFIYKFLMRHLKIICAVLIAVYLVYIRMADAYSENVYTNTLNYLPNFAAGALLALFFYERKTWVEKFSQLHRGKVALIYVVTFIAMVISIRYSSGFFSQLTTKLLMCFFFVFAISDQIIFKNSPVKLERFPALTWLGKRTYGLYCYHGIVFTLYTFVPEHFKTGFINQLVAYLAAMLLTILFAAASYRYFETRFLLLKKNFYNSPGIQ